MKLEIDISGLETLLFGLFYLKNILKTTFYFLTYHKSWIIS